MPRYRLLTVVLAFVFVTTGLAQQVSDPDFDTSVAKPAYTKTHPKVLFDEAHNNFHTTTGRYKPFADWITHDGYAVTPNKQKLTKEALAGFDVLVISNALGAPMMGSPEASNPAFTDEECDAVRDWVKQGGNLLLIADHAPMGAAAEKLSVRFGVDMSKGYTGDTSSDHIDSGTRASSNTTARTAVSVTIPFSKDETPVSESRRSLRLPGSH